LTAVTQATYLGGSGVDYALAIALDASGNVFVAGFTDSTNFPGTAGGAQAANGGGIYDAFVAKLNNGLTKLTQATNLGGSGWDQVNAIALDASGNVFVAGETSSTNFPGTAGGAQAANGGDSASFCPNGNCPAVDAFVAKLANGLKTLTQATYLGGSGQDEASAIALNASGNVFVVGDTTSTNFPGTTGGAQAAYVDGGDAFVAKLTPDLLNGNRGGPIKLPIYRPKIPWYEWPQILLILAAVGVSGVLVAVVGVAVMRRRRNRKRGP
jgi:Beta-propeller repeat